MNDASVFLDTLDASGNFTFQTFDDSRPARKQLAQMRHGTFKQHERWLLAQNETGAGIFVTVNQTDGKGRQYKNIQRVRALFVDLDGSPVDPVRAAPLAPHMVVESSPNRWHAYWLISDCALEDFKPLQRGLIALYQADHACVDLPRVMRIPGFWHKKADPYLSKLVDINERAAYTTAEVLTAFGWATPADADPEHKPKAQSAPSGFMPKSDADLADDLRDALRVISPDDYEIWIRLGIALKSLPAMGEHLWTEWSAGSQKYDREDARKRWDGFRCDNSGHQAVFAEAKRCGWDPRKSPSNLRRQAARSANRNESPPPLDEESTQGAATEPLKLDVTIEALIARYELIYGQKQVWDCTLLVAMPFSAFSALVGREPSQLWMQDSRRRVRMAVKPPPKEKKKRDNSSGLMKVDRMLPRYALIYGDEAVFDREQRREITLGALRAYMGLQAVRDWGDHPAREVVNNDQVIFDPRRPLDDMTVCNIWGGWPITAHKGEATDQERVRNWLRVLHYVCGESEAVFDWVIKWIAYPLQYPGTKMRSSVIMHGPEGSGKNTIWDAVRRIYGDYGIQIGQTQLEQQWCDWLSAKLFIVGNEVLHRQEQVQQKGRLKSIVTDETIRIERKFINGRTERNFANLVFLSNEEQPLSIDPGDRRFLVVWTPPAHPDGKAFYHELGEDNMPASTVQALYEYFLTVPLDDFNAHTKPIMTQAKQDLIDISLEGHRRFIRDWLAGELPVKCRPCRSQLLYHAYLWWCRENGERFPKPENKFAVRAKKEMRHGSKRYLAGMDNKQSIFYLPGDCSPPPDKSESTWLGNENELFRKELKVWQNEWKSE